MCIVIGKSLAWLFFSPFSFSFHQLAPCDLLYLVLNPPMPPKQQGGKGGKGKSAGDAAAEEKRGELEGLQKECAIYERMMVICSEQLQRSQLESLNLKKKIAELNEKFEKEEELTNKTTAEIFKAYRSNQSALVARIESHQATIEGLRKSLDEARHELERMKSEKDAIIAEKTKQINEQKQKMEQMAIEFGSNLKETLEQMSLHIQGGQRDVNRAE